MFLQLIESDIFQLHFQFPKKNYTCPEPQRLKRGICNLIDIRFRCAGKTINRRSSNKLEVQSFTVCIAGRVKLRLCNHDCGTCGCPYRELHFCPLLCGSVVYRRDSCRKASGLLDVSGLFGVPKFLILLFVVVTEPPFPKSTILYLDRA